MTPRTPTPPNPYRQPPIVVECRRCNSIGTAGFILAILAMIGCWIPVAAWILWIFGFLFSVIGIFKSPRGLAIAGFIISIAGLTMILIAIGLLSGLLALAASAMMI